MKYFQIVPENINLDFIGKAKYFFVVSGLVCAAIVFGLLTKGLNFGIDFTGGTVIQAKFQPALPVEQVRDMVGELGYPDASVVSLESKGADHTEYLITVRGGVAEKNAVPLHQKLVTKVGADKMTIQAVDVVGPKVGAELKSAALKSLILSIVFITIYIWLRFDIRFAPGATIAMIHDLIMVSGFYLISQREFTITAVASLLTIAGFSVNDTIVIYDRVREMLHKAGDHLPLPATINRAVNLTLSRTLITAGVAFLSVVPIVVFCDGELQSFGIAMLIGILVGIYSTVYMASPFTIIVERFMNRKNVPSSPRRPVTT